MPLDFEDLCKQERNMVQASINSERDFDEFHEALILQHSMIRTKESRRTASHTGKGKSSKSCGKAEAIYGYQGQGRGKGELSKFKLKSEANVGKPHKKALTTHPWTAKMTGSSKPQRRFSERNACSRSSRTLCSCKATPKGRSTERRSLESQVYYPARSENTRHC